MALPLVFTAHAKTMMHERMIQEDWVFRTVDSPDMTEEKRADERHYIKRIPENGMKALRVVASPSTSPPGVITMFFDRRV